MTGVSGRSGDVLPWLARRPWRAEVHRLPRAAALAAGTGGTRWPAALHHRALPEPNSGAAGDFSSAPRFAGAGRRAKGRGRTRMAVLWVIEVGFIRMVRLSLRTSKRRRTVASRCAIRLGYAGD